MVNVIGVRFENAGKLYFFDPGELWPTPGNYVLVETSRGVEFGEVVTGVKEIDDAMLQSPLKPVVRIATAEDLQHNKDNKAAEKEAYQVCQKKIAEHKLDMKLVSVEYTFDNSKILFYFTANGRVDFRSLVKDLAGVFKTRIELRQIGVRDEAKMLGGLGVCGRPICCGAFLGDFQPVSIKMAKEQNLSLNPTKISGVCGRLMCCLKYEQDQYEQTRKKMPKIGKEVITPDGPGVVWDLNIIKETVRVRIQKGDSSELKDFPMEEVQRPGAANVRREEPEEARKAEDKPEVQEAAQQMPAPVRRERPNREDRKNCREEGEKPVQRREEQRAQEAAAEAVKPAARTEEKPAVKPAETVKPAEPETTAAPAADGWKAALERAMKEAGNAGK
ncbi:MAG: stage 0 sporulation family protein [Clostridia bacterium]|nr:stage 0 sporulation family protein [Clostridia bacterium]